MLKESFNYNSNDSIEFDSDDEKDVSHIKAKYESTMIAIKELVAEVEN